MSSKTELTFDILGNDKSGSAAFKKVGKSAAGAKTDVDKFGGGLDSVGERADVGERRITGVKDTIEGLGAVMAGPGAIGTDAYLQGLADLSSGVAEGVVPALKLAKEKFKDAAKSALDWAKANKGLVVAGAGAAVGIGVLIGVISNAAAEGEQFRTSLRNLGSEMVDTGFDGAKLARRIEKTEQQMGDFGDETTAAVLVLADAARGVIEYGEAHNFTGLEMASLTSMQKELARALRQGDVDRATQLLADMQLQASQTAGVLKDELEKALSDVDAAASAFNESLFGTADKTAAAMDAGDKWNEMLADLTVGNTELAQAGQDLITSNFDLGMSEGELTALMQTTRDQFIENRIAAGEERAEAEELANSLGLIPGNVHTAYEESGYDIARGKADKLEEALNRLDGKVVRTTVETTHTFLGVPFSTKELKAISSNATGGPVRRGEVSLVGEEGPEIVKFDGAGEVIPHQESMRMLRSAGSSGSSSGSAPAAAAPIVIENHIEIGGEVVRVVRQEIGQSNRQTRRKVGAGAGAAR